MLFNNGVALDMDGEATTGVIMWTWVKKLSVQPGTHKMDLTRNSFLEINVDLSLIQAPHQKVFKQQQGIFYVLLTVHLSISLVITILWLDRLSKHKCKLDIVPF